MTPARLIVLIGLAAAATAYRAPAYEVNDWPVYVAQKDSTGRTISWTGAGPFLFSGPTPGPDAGTASGFRPFYGKVTGGGSVRTDILYPLFFDRKYPESYKWSFYDLINGEGIDSGVTEAGGPKDKHFDVWPFYFSHETGNPVDSYRGLLPIAGTIKYRLWFNRIHWVLFPLFVQTEKRGRTSTYTPWPIVRFVRGSEKGFDLWPLFGVTNGPGAAHHSFFVWPLAWDNVLEPTPNAPEGSKPTTEFGILPLYTSRVGPGKVDVSYLWPFFGYTEQTLPQRYSEKRYFWPFLVQGRGDVRTVDRWGPFYTHSDNRGLDSKWVVWPLWHQKQWVDANIEQTKTQLFYFVYWSLYQRDVDRPGIAPAYKRHVWPILSIWDNGAGSRQVEFPSPLEVFFPDNPDMREIWTPLFSIYKYDHQPTGESRNSVLWSAVTWRRNETQGLVEFHIGPLLGMRKTMSGKDWTILGFDFGNKMNKDTTAHR